MNVSPPLEFFHNGNTHYYNLNYDTKKLEREEEQQNYSRLREGDFLIQRKQRQREKK